MIIGILGILKAGGAYIPMDPNYPNERLKYIFRDSDTNLILTNEVHRERLTKIIHDNLNDLAGVITERQIKILDEAGK